MKILNRKALCLLTISLCTLALSACSALDNYIYQCALPISNVILTQEIETDDALNIANIFKSPSNNLVPGTNNNNKTKIVNYITFTVQGNVYKMPYYPHQLYRSTNLQSDMIYLHTFSSKAKSENPKESPLPEKLNALSLQSFVIDKIELLDRKSKSKIHQPLSLLPTAQLNPKLKPLILKNKIVLA